MDYVHLLARVLGFDHYKFSKERLERLEGLDLREVETILEDDLDLLSI